MVVEESNTNMQIVSVFDMLMKDRIIFLGTEIYDEIANTINAQLLYLDSITDSNNPEPIWLYINSPGGEIYSGLSIYDTINMIKSPVYTVVMGLAASMAFVLATSGEKGHRYSLPNSRLMLHQPLGGAIGQATDIDIENKEIQLLKNNNMCKSFIISCIITYFL
jgi:ATP-dependent Clp protease protease subunit